ncbi:MAG TPA: CAP domain-containing protein [Solirubrobacteraceae bacterium]
MSSPTPASLRLPAAVLAAFAGLLVLFPYSARAADPVSRAVVWRLNAVRAAHGLRPLGLSHRLERAARWQSGSMRSRRSLSHGNPNGQARLTRVCRAMHARTVGETIGWIRSRRAGKQAAGIVRWWMNSPAHRAVLMSPSFRRVGVGRRIGRFGGRRVVWFTADLSG